MRNENMNEPINSQSCKTRVIGSILRWGFKIINWNHFRLKSYNGKPYYKKIVRIKGFRTAVVDSYDGNRTTNRFYWSIGRYYL